ncbi:MAG: cytochrome d ubiquinol oxidase subunit II [Pyrinomonadaceae bacterium]|nr:cytochrome d ubiquinol oxidase subunit II [Pyrinomonadaceae bacterium]MCX7639601.1 cytochrome d ubiquinol oxidase subunit II [Pyrinomonadaceae bacterium]MDW8303994.1 cytochrome d ubiquinol oxidase subunit II [Acidobacteriota bacterium]
MSPEIVVAAILVVSIIIYALLGGADYGGGVWDLLAFGERKEEQRILISHSIGPVWEANHIWLILALVILFVAFPKAYSILSVALHIPLTIMLIGIVLRGASFAFRSYGNIEERTQKLWGLVFSISSIITPIFIGVNVGAIVSGRIVYEEGTLKTNFFDSWLGIFPLATGVFTLSLFALLAATYLTLEAKDSKQLQEDFRLRALISQIFVVAIAFLVLVLAKEEAPRIYEGMTSSWYSTYFHITTASCIFGAIASLWKRKFREARIFVAGQTVLIILGCIVSQFPFIIVPSVTIQSAAAPRLTLELLIGGLMIGSIVLFPSIYYLFRIFKSQ